jgi:hypothetical protein
MGYSKIRRWNKKSIELMIYRDQAKQVIIAYLALLKNQVILEGAPVTVGTRIPYGKTEYIHISVDDIENQGTGEKPIYRVYVTLEAVSIQAKTEGDETKVNTIIEQVLELTSDLDNYTMNDFTCIMVMPQGLEHDTEHNEANYNIIRKLRNINYVEQQK